MSLWVSLTGEINSLSEKKGALTELSCFGSADSSEEFVSLAKQLIGASSHLVEVLSEPNLGLSEDSAAQLKKLASTFSRDCISFVHAARGFLFDKDNAKERFHESSKRLDERLEALLDHVLALMTEEPQPGVAVPASAVSTSPVKPSSPRRPPPPPPVASISSSKLSDSQTRLSPPPMPPRRPSANAVEEPAAGSVM